METGYIHVQGGGICRIVECWSTDTGQRRPSIRKGVQMGSGPLPWVAILQQGSSGSQSCCNIVRKITDILTEPEECPKVGAVPRRWKLPDCVGEFWIRFKVVHRNHVSFRTHRLLRKLQLLRVQGHIMFGRPGE